ncbi:MAG: hypothetical protein IPK16_11940 [Anaerolineales bacterium]|nr:hypothetical protein [Anaerolineales bacterium]
MTSRSPLNATSALSHCPLYAITHEVQCPNADFALTVHRLLADYRPPRNLALGALGLVGRAERLQALGLVKG